MKPKVRINDKNECPFWDFNSVICETSVCDERWYEEATHICSCPSSRGEKL